MSFHAKLQWESVATLYFVIEVALSTTIKKRKKKKKEAQMSFIKLIFWL